MCLLLLKPIKMAVKELSELKRIGRKLKEMSKNSNKFEEDGRQMEELSDSREVTAGTCEALQRSEYGVKFEGSKFHKNQK
jgi:hypothetical protein